MIQSRAATCLRLVIGQGAPCLITLTVLFLCLGESHLRAHPGSHAVAPLEQAISSFEKRVEVRPNDAVSRTVLANLYLRRAKAKSSLQDLVSAEKQCRKALELLPGYPVATQFLSRILYEQHRFSEARDLSLSLLNEDPEDSQSLIQLADAQLALGDYEGAEKGYQKLLSSNRTPAVLIRLSRLAQLKGNPSEAIGLAQEAVGKAQRWSLTEEKILWFRTFLADLYLDTGHFEAAEDILRSNLERYPDHALSYRTLGKLLTAQGQTRQAIEVYEQLLHTHQDPELLVSLGALYRQTGNEAEAEKLFSSVEAIASRTSLRGIFDRELSSFYADYRNQPRLALDRARRDFNRRQDIYAYDTLAWALYKNGNYGEAAVAMEKALQLGTQDATLFFHAGMIFAQSGELERSRKYLKQASAWSPHVYPDSISSR